MRPRLGICGVSYIALFYDGAGLSSVDFVRRAKRLGVSGVELDGRAPQAMPYLLDRHERAEIRTLLADEGMELVCIGGYNDFSSPVLEHRGTNIIEIMEKAFVAARTGVRQTIETTF